MQGGFQGITVTPPDVEHIAGTQRLRERIAARWRGDHAGLVGTGRLRARVVVDVVERRPQRSASNLGLCLRLVKLGDRNGNVEVLEIGGRNEVIQLARSESGPPMLDGRLLGALAHLEMLGDREGERGLEAVGASRGRQSKQRCGEHKGPAAGSVTRAPKRSRMSGNSA